MPGEGPLTRERNRDGVPVTIGGYDSPMEKVKLERLAVLGAGKMGFSTTAVGDMVAEGLA